MSRRQPTLPSTKRGTARMNRPLLGPLCAREPKRSLPWWAWVIIAELALVLLPLLWWWLRRRRGEQRMRHREEQRITVSRPLETTPIRLGGKRSGPSRWRADPTPAASSPPLEEPAPDDLKRIEGIGPKISSVFQKAGITTFAQLATSEASRLEHILREAGIGLADPTTWPEQASLAAAGNWDALEKLQGELKGGRRV